MLSLADATTIGFSAPIFATILSALILGEKVGRHRWGAVVVGFLGIAIVVQPGASGSEISRAGLAIALLSALGTAGVTITLRQLSRTEHPAGIVFWFFTYSLVAGAVLVAVNGSMHAPMVLAILCAGGMMGGTAQLLMTASLKFAPVSVVAPFDYLQFLWAVLFGWLIWDHGVSAATWTGAAVIIGSGLYTVWREQRLRIRPSDSATATGALSE
jgi:drug/metabolite transporter (DMT)-like permease